MTSNLNNDSVGILPRAIDTIFDKIDAKKGNPKFKMEMKITFMEIYNEDLRDLLTTSSNNTNKQLSIREKEGSAFVDGLTEISVVTKVDIGT